MLEVKNLSVSFNDLKAVDNVSFAVNPGKTLGLLGESGSGKSTVALSILNLVAEPGRITNGQILLDDREGVMRGAKVSMIFQDPFSSLNPVFTIGDQIVETVMLHQGVSKIEAVKRAKDLLLEVKIDPRRINDYPHQFSGGQRQRVMIAIALSCEPEYLIADEPTTALDVTIQSEILDLIKDLQRKKGFGMIFITHNFHIAKKVCDDYVVMKRGRVVDAGKDVFSNPKSEYTKELIRCMDVLYG